MKKFELRYSSEKESDVVTTLPATYACEKLLIASQRKSTESRLVVVGFEESETGTRREISLEHSFVRVNFHVWSTIIWRIVQ